MICWRGWSEAKAKAAAAAILIWCQQRRKYPISKNYNNKSLLGSENRMVVWKDWENGNGFEGSIGNGIATRMEIYLQGVVGVVGWREILLLKISDFFHLKKKKKNQTFLRLKNLSSLSSNELNLLTMFKLKRRRKLDYFHIFKEIYSQIISYNFNKQINWNAWI